MGSEWKEVFLTDIYEIRSGLSKPAKYFGSGFPFLAFKDVFNNYFVPEKLSQLVQSNEKEQEGCSIKRGDVFLTRTSETMHELGMSSVALKDYEHATFNGFSKRLRPKLETNVIPEYVGYYLRSTKFRNEMMAFSTMSTRASLNNEMISRLRLMLPSIDEQKSIAWILKCLDDKIELNRQTNQTLEQMAQTLFKSWFVDFDPVFDNALVKADYQLDKLPSNFPEALLPKAEKRLTALSSQVSKQARGNENFPSEFEFNEQLGWFPKGWKASTTDNEFVVKGGSTPSTKNPDFWEGGDIHWTSPKDLSGNDTKIMLDTNRKITAQGLTKITSGLLPIDTVLMSSRAPVGYLALAKVPVAINQGYIAITDAKTLTSEYTIQWLDSVMDEIKSISGGTTFAEISKKTFKSINLVIPYKEVVEAYTAMAKASYQRITANVQEINTLTETRDYLLPKLISGEIKLSDVNHD